MIGVIVSQSDEASVAIWEQLASLGQWERHDDRDRPPEAGGGDVYRYRDFEVRTFEELHLHLERPAAAFDDPEMVVFISRHAGETGRLLTAHFPGNFGEAAYGGAPRSLPVPASGALSTVYAALRETAPPAYSVGIECTHHGPTDVGAPTLFVELGSDSDAWQDPEGAAAVAAAVVQLSGTCPRRERSVVGVGGGHYAPKFERIVAETDWDVGHIAAEWALAEIGDVDTQTDRIEDALALSRTDLVLIDEAHEALADRLSTRGYRIVSETWIRETTGVDRSVIDVVEERLGRIETGTRFGDEARERPSELYERRLPEELLAELQRIDRDRTQALIARHTVAYDTSESGHRMEPAILVPSRNAYDTIIEDAVAMLESQYPSVERRTGRVIVRSERFDPEAAAALGVPEGPLFGKLAAGESIELDGDIVSPEAVMAVDERSIPLERD